MSRIFQTQQPELSSGMLFKHKGEWHIVLDPDAGGRGTYATLTLIADDQIEFSGVFENFPNSSSIDATIESELGKSRALAGYQIRDVLRSTSESDLEQIRESRYWRREEKRKMTVAEIEKKLGYGIEIVKG